MAKKTAAKPKGRAPAKPAAKTPTFGQRLIGALKELGDPDELAEATLAGQAPAGATYTVTRGVPLTGAAVAELRGQLGLSQAAFAAFLGASVQTVQAWEQERNPVQGIAHRFLSVIRDDVPYWRAKLAAG